MGYTDTFIIVAEDCAAETGVVPPERGGRPTMASIQHALLAAAPYTQDDVLIKAMRSRGGSAFAWTRSRYRLRGCRALRRPVMRGPRR